MPKTAAAMATHTFAFLDSLGFDSCDVLGFSLSGMVAQHMLFDRPTIFRRMLLVGTAPRGGEGSSMLKLEAVLNARMVPILPAARVAASSPSG